MCISDKYLDCLDIQFMCYVHVLLRFIYDMEIKPLVLCSHWHSDLFFRYELNDEVFGNYFFLSNKSFIYRFFTLHVHEGKCLTDFMLSNLFCVGRCIHNQYVISCIKIYSHPIFSDWLYLILFWPIINSDCRDV